MGEIKGQHTSVSERDCFIIEAEVVSSTLGLSEKRLEANACSKRTCGGIDLLDALGVSKGPAMAK